MATKRARLVVALSGSPRKGANTDAVLKQVLKGAAKAGARTKFIRLADLAIKGCCACYYCHTHNACAIKDDMTKVYAALKKADAWVFGTPVYWFTMSAQLKAPVDRLFALAFGPKKLRRGKRVAVVTLCGDDAAEAMGKPIFDVFAKGFPFLGVKFAGRLALVGVERKDVAERWADFRPAQSLGARLAK